MQFATKDLLAKVAQEKALLPFHGFLADKESNLQPILSLFPKWNIIDADGMWCAAFVYYCCITAGFQIPYSPDECVSCSLAGCGGWEDFALGDSRIAYYLPQDPLFVPAKGDIILYDRVFLDSEHDHMGIIIENKPLTLVVAEGNTLNGNISGILERNKDDHIRAYIRLPEFFSYYAQ
ncbi:CHAP domain-containing protein [Scatolibacter rhodanostii]|uniref:CHAP domain-containing protein n=1 Tax=Scatolibacter rhodanostii TaxID=2014781 RepID=UPI000C087A74|nr:CHAP domain-containing protein [Scatolibacter rhodanostii]